MKPLVKEVTLDNLSGKIKSWLQESAGRRLSFVSSIDGRQLVCLLLDLPKAKSELWVIPVAGDSYNSLTVTMPGCHWFERSIWDMFGLKPEGHPRLKHLLLHGEYESSFNPLRNESLGKADAEDFRDYKFLEVKGEGVYEIPVGPIHAGVIEPGHFRFSCFGEDILNLEIRLGYLHRGVEKRITEVPWQKAHFVAEAAASDTAVANALAHATVIESIIGVSAPPLAKCLRTAALEIERLAMHIIDVGGMAADVGFLGISSSMGRLRGRALGLAQALSGNRFMRGFVIPGGVLCFRQAEVDSLKKKTQELKAELMPVLELFKDNQVAVERMQGIGHISRALAEDFGIVGVAARASGVAYDTRQHFEQGNFPQSAPPIVVQSDGDILARTLVRIGEIETSIAAIEAALSNLPDGAHQVDLPQSLPADSWAVGIVEAFRGELIHLAHTDGQGRLMRYAIKDPSVNNWTALSIAIRSNLIADFPLCNKSFSLSYSGNDL